MRFIFALYFFVFTTATSLKKCVFIIPAVSTLQKTSFLQSRLKKTSVLRTRETLFRLIFTSGMMIRSIRLGGSNPQKCRIYGLFQPFSFVIRATHSTWHEETILIVICLVRSWELIYQSVILPKAVNGNIPTVLPVRGNVSIIHHGWQ